MNNNVLQVLIGLLLPFMGTSTGCALIFLLKDKMNIKFQKMLLGFASGVMIAASIFSLLLPSMELAKGVSWLPAAVGFMGGILFLLFLDSVIPHLHLDKDKPEGLPSKLNKSFMLVLAVTLHNIPEGMAVGVVLSAMLKENSVVTFTSAFVLSLGIAIQNFPEGAVVSAPLVQNGMSKKKAFLYGVLSGVVEPIGAILIMLLSSMLTPLLPYLLSFAAGAMIYVVVEELIPESQMGEHTNIATLATSIGFVLMMILDVALS